MKILTTASALLYGCATFKPTAAEDDGLQRRLLRGNPAPKGHSQPAERVSNMSGDDAEGAVGKASTAMLMGRPLEWFLSDNVPFDDQKSAIIRMAGDSWNGGKKIVITEESAEDISSYLVSQVDAGLMGEDAARTVAIGMGLSARELFATGPGENDIGAVEAVYDTYEGNMARVSTSHTLNYYNIRDKKFYNGIWGYSTGDREYALQCHGYGIAIIDVTPNKTPPFTFYARRVQLIYMAGGDQLRDVVTYKSPSNGKTYAYVGAQNRDFAYFDDPSALWVIDLSYLSGDQPHRTDSKPIPRDAYKEISGYNGYTHTINAAKGLLFLHPYGVVSGCQVLDITNDPMEPKKLFAVADGCHDSYVRENIEGKDILFVSDANSGGERIYDITDVDANTSRAPKQLGITDTSIGIFDHSSWLSEDNRYLFVFDESTVGGKGIVVYDVEDLTNPVEIARFKTSLAKDVDGTVPHNGMIRGGYLYAAYYGAGLRVFDITNPLQPVEVGKVETDRDPEGYGSHDSGFRPGIGGAGGGAGAWNTYFLPSGNILVNDMYNGLFVVRAYAPYSSPSRPKLLTAKRMNGDNEKVQLDWDAVPNARGYSVQRKRRARDEWKTIAEHLVEPSYIDTYNKGAFYRIGAINGEGYAVSGRKKVKTA